MDMQMVFYILALLWLVFFGVLFFVLRQHGGTEKELEQVRRSMEKGA
ncbi:MAG: hypothetical protein MUC42_07505 [Bryobacter sp.]|jgi:preprotein translocase subunit YajC|nr:hypothetical protein [Bryobacter sp.]